MVKTVTVPSSKSHSIRALCIALFSRSVSEIINLSDCDDVKSCLTACETLGAKIEKNKDRIIIDSTQINGKDDVVIDCGNSGTTLFFLTALCSTLNCKVTFTGDESLKKRSAENLLNSLADLGVIIEGKTLPYSVHGPVKGGSTQIDCPTSQYLSALLMSVPLAQNSCIISVKSLNEKPYVQMTEDYLEKQNIQYTENGQKYVVEPNQKYKGLTCSIPGDFSAATPFFAYAALTGSKVKIKNLDINDTQPDRCVIKILQEMGCSVTTGKNDVILKGSEHLKAVDMDLNSMPDSLPVMAVVSCFADKPIRIYNVAHARIKETDRIHVMAMNLNSIGADIKETEDGLIVNPVGYFNGGEVDSFMDHRIAMAMAVSSLKCRNSLIILNKECAAVSFPDFFTAFEEVGK